jgi:hypothetical protein
MELGLQEALHRTLSVTFVQMFPIAFTRSYPQQKKVQRKEQSDLQNMKNFCVKDTGRQKALDKEKRFQERLIKYFQTGNGRVAGRRVWGRGGVAGSSLINYYKLP